VQATLLNLAFPLIAQAAADPAAKGPADGSSSMLTALLPFVAIFVLFYFLLIRPQRREQARRQDMLGGVKKNDRIVTVGGIYGVVTNVHREADEVTIKVDEATNTKLRITLSSVGRVMGDEPGEEPSK
jgi:preprotein translocase subunit YajC